MPGEKSRCCVATFQECLEIERAFDRARCSGVDVREVMRQHVLPSGKASPCALSGFQESGHCCKVDCPSRFILRNGKLASRPPRMSAND